MSYKIGTLNLCLGLPNKKDDVKIIILEENLDILFMQETEIQQNSDINSLSFGGFNIEIENTDYKARVAAYIKNGVDYVRRADLEGKSMHIIVIDLPGAINYRIINVYRSFSPPVNMSQRQYFLNQLATIKMAMCERCVVLGDFNLDWSRFSDSRYAFKNYMFTLCCTTTLKSG